MIRRPPRSTLFPTRRSSDLRSFSATGDTAEDGARGGDAADQGRVAACVRLPVNLRSEEHTSELQSPCNLVCRLLLEKKKKHYYLRRTDSYASYDNSVHECLA